MVDVTQAYIKKKNKLNQKRDDDKGKKIFCFL